MAESITSEEVDFLFDSGEDVIQHADMSTFERPNKGAAQRRVSVDMPAALIERLDEVAERRGVNRQAVIKMWLWDRLEEEERKEAVRQPA